MRFVDAEEEFFAALSGVIDPEAKRHRVGEEFIKVFKRVAQEVGAGYLIQGTIAPDWIESGGGLRDRIKSHHNVGGLPERLNLILVEPLRDLYKDEIRELARYLKIEELYHQPFPGPGLAVRIAGEVTPKRVELVREACAIVEEEIERAAERKEIALPWQYFAMLLSARAVGVRGDLRSYGYAVMIRAIESTDGMTAAPSRLPYPVLERIAARITSSLKEVTRVGYEVTGKPPATIEWE
jgi:GMP synthase (glutamine-hydrolysing)